MTENQEVKSKKDLLMERYKAEQPDVEFADDEALFGKISEDYEDYDKMKGEYGTLKEDADVIKDFFAKSPDSAVLFSVIRKDPNHNLVSALIDVYGEEIKDALESEEAKAKLAEASQAYAKRVAENDELEKIAAENLEVTDKNCDEVQAEKGLTDEEMDAVLADIIKVANDAQLNLVSKETLVAFINARKHDDDVAQAEQEGEIRGRNTKIEEKLRKAKAGDGTPNLGSKNAGGNARPMPDFGAIGANYGTQNIYERGGEKRKTYKQ